jgi:hypothetical protein
MCGGGRRKYGVTAYQAKQRERWRKSLSEEVTEEGGDREDIGARGDGDQGAILGRASSAGVKKALSGVFGAATRRMSSVTIQGGIAIAKSGCIALKCMALFIRRR